MKTKQIVKTNNKELELDIKKATLKDLDKIIDIQKNDGFKHAYYLPEGRLAKLVRRGEAFYIAFSKTKALGFISADMEVRAKIHFFSVKEKWGGKGVGVAMLTKILNEVKRNGYRFVYIYVEIDSPIEEFLIKKGFYEVGIYRNRYSSGRHAHILEVNIQEYFDKN